MEKLIERMRKHNAEDNKSECPKAANSDPIPVSIDELKDVLGERIGFKTSYDINLREMVFCGAKTAILCLNGLSNDELITLMIERFSYTSEIPEGMSLTDAFSKLIIPHIQVQPFRTLTEIIGAVFTGSTAVFFEGEETALMVDMKNYPSRSTEEPDLERVVRGSRDGFVESLVVNTSLVRRRIRDPKLRFETTKVGLRTSTDVCIGYIKDIADPTLVKAIHNRINNITIDGLPLAEKQLEEAMIEKSSWSPYPLVRYSERPDVVAAHLLEGHITIFVDTSPSVMVFPATFFHHLQHAEESREAPVVGTYLRWVRFIGVMVSIFLLPLWYLLVVHPELKPPFLDFIGPKKMSEIPVLVQFLFAELGIDLMRMASVHTPSPLATAMGLVAAILIGDIAVKTGLFINEVILYLAVAVLGTFATPSYELGLANRLVRLALLIVTSIFGVSGFVVGTTLWLIYLVRLRSYNSPYMWPFIPFNFNGMMAILIRWPVKKDNKRPSLVKPLDHTKQNN
ncbi:spore germination protein [Paenibacillus albiflavus]|uniref:Spore germination protein n=1 Tax=Paenibacillus albiflavus TaxID=2545760 RepID=A0A4R4EEI9_9BACL|nr:spore germination protein [Paenibacillus albiflavus]TCZ77500.1 spore germination protein [Paenibacillus albiflavus]